MSERARSWVQDAWVRQHWARHWVRRWPPFWLWLQHAWWLPPACWALVVVLDAVLRRAPNYFLLGLVDEPAHLLTSLIDVLAVTALLTAIGRRPPSAAWAASALLAGNLIDADHVPQVLGYQGFTEHTPRPYTHSLTTVAILLLLAALPLAALPLAALPLASRSRTVAVRTPACRTVASRTGRRWSAVTAGSAVGVAGHLFRDAGTAPVALFWPFSYRSVDFPEQHYTVVLLVLALITPIAFALALLRPERARRKHDDDG